jgi:rhamnosyltransferase
MDRVDEQVAAGIVLFNPDLELLDRLLCALDRNDRNIFVFVNGKTEPAVDDSLARLSKVHTIKSSANIGLGAGLNELVKAAEAAGFKNVLLFDQDSSPEPALPDALCECAEQLQIARAPVAVVGPRLVVPPGENYKPLRYSRRRPSGLPCGSAVDFLPTSGSLVSIAAWREIGPFRVDYFVDGIDIEWCYRAWHQGYACVLADDLEMVHRWGTPAEHRGRNDYQVARQSDLRSYYHFRNAVHSLRLPHMPWRWRAPQFARLVAQAFVFARSRGFQRSSWVLLHRAWAAGLAGRLGPAPPDFASEG